MLFVPGEAEPGEILANPLRIRLARTLLVGIVEPQDESPALLPRPQPIVDGGADIADMEPSRRRGGEAGDDAHRRRLGRSGRIDKGVRAAAGARVRPSLSYQRARSRPERATERSGTGSD